MICSFNLDEKDIDLLNKYIKKNKIKNKSVAISECINKTCNNTNLSDLFFDMDSKLNRLVHNVFLIRKLQEQFFTNMEFYDNNDPKIDKCLNEFLDKTNRYRSHNSFLS